MTDLTDDGPRSFFGSPRPRLGPAFLIYFHIGVCCLSLVYVAEFYGDLQIIMFDGNRLQWATLNIAPFAIVSILFTFAEFSFGYVLGFYFYTMVLGYLWLVVFSKFHYDHSLAALSAFASALAFILPALFITSPVKQRYVLSARAFERLLLSILISAAAIATIGVVHNFRLVGITEIYKFRAELNFPTWLRYAMGVTTNALLPFAFACFFARGQIFRATGVILLLSLFYPITLSKASLFAAFWLLFLALLSRLFEVRGAVVISLLLPTSIGVMLVLLFKVQVLSHSQIAVYFGTVNFRMIALPSIGLDLYSDFFSTHDLTYFCQINFLKSLVSCPYNEPLALLMQRTYQIGNFNASLFATEGIASVGLIAAPAAVLACGLLISLGNRLSCGLPPKFILLSMGMLPQVFLNVPLTIAFLTNGTAIIFLLWYITPRTIFSLDAGKRTAVAS
ncbi:hypothetical protein IVB41_27385 [Bradyrhizobium sp. 44]|uniref:hypothetical protein n=1 Tax=Bradyrhizobium sp. 44 TaxID=2782675 RepID=UPI001FFACD18|nr:hypothetical protein [Bradyrhizobium sp. 44]MCK1287632.1 hypothetical protein [Bradyrhizobium sp. 44]